MPASKTGFLGSCYFIGIIMSIYYVPLLSDQNGRFKYIAGSIVVQIVGQTGLIFTQNINHAYLFMLCIGITFPGRSIILYNYALELVLPAYKQYMINTVACNHNTTLIMITWYVFNYRQWMPLQIMNWCLISVCLIFTLLML